MEIIQKYFAKSTGALGNISNVSKEIVGVCVRACVFKRNLFGTTANCNGEKLVLEHKSLSVVTGSKF